MVGKFRSQLFPTISAARGVTCAAPGTTWGSGKLAKFLGGASQSGSVVYNP